MSFERELTTDEVDKIFKKRGISSKPGDETLELTDAEVDALLGTNYAKGNHKRPDATKFGKNGKAAKTHDETKVRKHRNTKVEPSRSKHSHKNDIETKVRKPRSNKVEPPRKLVTRPVEKKVRAKHSGKLLELTKESQFRDLLENNERVVLFFGSEGCPACQALHPLYERIANRYHEKVTLAYADVDKYQINFKYVPVFQIFYRGEKKDEIIGASVDELKEFIAQALKVK